MTAHSDCPIHEHMNVVGADGVRLGTVDHLDGTRIRLTRDDSAAMREGDGARHQFIGTGLVNWIEGDTVHLSTTAANAATLFEAVY